MLQYVVASLRNAETLRAANLLPIREQARIPIMHIVSQKALRLFWEKHPDAEQSLRAWYVIAKRAQWRSPADIKADYRSASIIGNNRVVFNIKGNTYRLVVMTAYQQGRLFIRFVGTHAEYNGIDVETI